MIELVTYVTVGIAAASAVMSYLWRRRALLRKPDARWQNARPAAEPVTLHPSVDHNRCISIGACAEACPGNGVFVIVDGNPQLIDPARCVGHGACADACPMEAITLVLGTPTTGVEVPVLGPNLETNVEGAYVAGELGGVALIRNAVAQGKTAVEHMTRTLGGRSDVPLDLVIVGAGPAGISATLEAKRRGLRYVTLDQDGVGGTVLSYPRHKIVMTQPMVLPIVGKTRFREIPKEQLLSFWGEVIAKAGVEIRTHEKVESISRNGAFAIKTSKGEYHSKKLLLALGRRGTPRKLGVPGEDSGKVTYRLIEPEQYRGKRVLVVGGGDSAVEAALAVAAVPGCTVTLSYRRDSFTRIKPANAEKIEHAQRNGTVAVRLRSQVKRIESDHVIVEDEGCERTLPNDYVLVFAGGELPTKMLSSIGIRIDTKFGEA